METLEPIESVVVKEEPGLAEQLKDEFAEKYLVKFLGNSEDYSEQQNTEMTDYKLDEDASDSSSAIPSTKRRSRCNGSGRTKRTPPKEADTEEINFDALLQAVKSCLMQNMGIRVTAREHGINRSSLQRYVQKVKAEFDNVSSVSDDALMDFIRTSHMKIPKNMVFSATQEKVLVEYILKCVNHYYGLSIKELRELAYHAAIKWNLQYPSTWDDDSKAGRVWYYKFMKRHPELTLRTPEQTSINRAKGFCKQNVDHFFANLSQLLDQHHFDRTSIYNMDESGFSNVPTEIGKVLALKGAKRVGKLEAAERGTMITMALTITASGNSIPPFFLFPFKTMQSCFLDNASPGTVGYANNSGSMCQPDFIRYISHFINFVKPSTDSPVLLLMDNHTSHISVEALDIAAANGVHILFFPPHCSHRLQPLDVTVFGPVKTYFKAQCSAWQKNNANMILEVRHIAGIVCAALDLALTPKTIKSGFAATGIAPYNPNIFTDDDFVQPVLQSAARIAVTTDLTENEQRHIEKEAPKSELDQPFCYSSTIEDIGPLQEATPKKPSNRERKPVKSTELTSPENLALLKENAATKKAAAEKLEGKKRTQEKATPKKSPPAKRLKRSTPSDDDRDFCVICLRFLPNKLTAVNSIACNSCKRPVHVECADIKASFYTCKHCDSDYDVQGFLNE